MRVDLEYKIKMNLNVCFSIKTLSTSLQPLNIESTGIAIAGLDIRN